MQSVALNSLSKIKFIGKYFSGIATIFMLHRVHPFESNKLRPNEDMKVSPEFLENLIQELKSSGYEFISLDRLHNILLTGEKVAKQIVFTLDDGYKDNYEIAYPMFKKHNVPFAVYITTSFPDESAKLWWYALEDLIVQNTEIILNGTQFNCDTNQNKIDAFMNIRNIIISFEGENFQENLCKLFSAYQIDWTKYCKELAMSWEQVKALSLDPLVTIGGHTKNHFSLNKLSEAEIDFEVLEANRTIASKINKPIEHFAYPFGSSAEIGQREFSIIKKMGFKTVTTTRRGNIYPEHKNYLECMPRIMLTENMNITEIGRIRRTKLVTA